MRVVVTGYLATYPLGGLAWHYLHYLLGLRAAGHEVFYLEDTGNWMYDPASQTFTDRIDNNLTAVAQVLTRFELADRWAVRGPDGTLYGSTNVADFLQTADVLLNVSGSCWLREEYLRIPRKAYIDTDPGYNQIRANRVMNGADDADLKYSIARMAEHDVHFTFGLNVGSADCLVPATPFHWRATRQPIALNYWPVQPPVSGGAFTTLMSWNAYAKPVAFEGRSYAGKESRLRRVIDLPRHVPGTQLELAISGQAPVDELRQAGWRLGDASAASADAYAFQRYIAGSRGEFSVAKDLYVQLRTGWFGDRTPAYLAAGRPAVVEDTGLGQHLPLGQGLLTFTNAPEAATAIQAVQANYATHAAAARRLAEDYFDAGKVLPALLGQ